MITDSFIIFINLKIVLIAISPGSKREDVKGLKKNEPKPFKVLKTMDMSTFVHSIGVHVYIMIIIFFSFFFSQLNFLQHRRTSVGI